MNADKVSQQCFCDTGVLTDIVFFSALTLALLPPNVCIPAPPTRLCSIPASSVLCFLAVLLSYLKAIFPATCVPCCVCPWMHYLLFCINNHKPLSVPCACPAFTPHIYQSFSLLSHVIPYCTFNSSENFITMLSSSPSRV